ncbi:MAG: hypothetical protein RL021_219, partial [Bacteroidota bacterium]|jgi:hypothetical protein
MKRNRLIALVLFASSMAVSHPSSAIKITFGTKCHPDDNGGCDGDKGICIIIEIKNAEGLFRETDPRPALGDDMAMAELACTDAAHIRLDILAQQSDVVNGPYFTVEQPVALNAELVTKLGLQYAVIQPGRYSVDYSTRRFGTVLLDAVTR